MTKTKVENSSTAKYWAVMKFQVLYQCSGIGMIFGIESTGMHKRSFRSCIGYANLFCIIDFQFV